MNPRPMSTTELLEAIIKPTIPGGFPIDIEAEPHWYSRLDGDLTEGEAQAIIKIQERLYTISLEKLP